MEKNIDPSFRLTRSKKKTKNKTPSISNSVTITNTNNTPLDNEVIPKNNDVTLNQTVIDDDIFLSKPSESDNEVFDTDIYLNSVNLNLESFLNKEYEFYLFF